MRKDPLCSGLLYRAVIASTISVRSWPALPVFRAIWACPLSSGFLPRSLHNRTGNFDPKATLNWQHQRLIYRRGSLLEKNMDTKAMAFGLVAAGILLCGCRQPTGQFEGAPQPKEIIDLGTAVTEDVTFEFWGKRLPLELGYERPNHFEVIKWSNGPIDGQNSYYTLFNHGGPHVDAPIHVGFEGALDSYPVESFAGPLRVFDVRRLSPGRTVTKGVFERADVRPGDVVLIYTGYKPPADDDQYPRVVSLTYEAAQFLADIPIRAFATDAWSVDVGPGDRPVEPTADPVAPVHTAFLSRGIPAYEQLKNVNTLLERGSALYFVGQPLNIKNGDGMIVRPLVFVY